MIDPHNRFSERFADEPSVAKPVDGSLAGAGILPANRPLPGALRAPELCSLASKWDRGNLPEGRGTAHIKANGVRAIWIGGPHRMLVSREGQRLRFGEHAVRSLDNLERAYREYWPTGTPMMFDGELAHPDGLNATLASLARGMPDHDITYWLFDAVPLPEWIAGGGKTGAPLDTRVGLLTRVFRSVHHPFVGKLRDIPVNSYSDVRELNRLARTEGHEGMVIKNGSSPYQRCRTLDWMKLKEDLR